MATLSRKLTPTDPEVLTAEAVAAMLGCGVAAARKLMREGAIPSKKPSRGWLTTRATVMKYLEEQK